MRAIPWGIAVARFVVFVGDFEVFELLGVGVHAHAIVIEAQVHGGGAGGPEPEGDFGGISSAIFQVDLVGTGAFAFEFHDRAHGAGLFEGDFFDGAGEGFLLQRSGEFERWGILAKSD